ncbi:hypothetical protein [Lusitaniella coriacea]|uniref:hypothetical protein n=1 Tax=Lusitaniella coriacea TaxID=1983105 RepID=UPI003CF00A46
MKKFLLHIFPSPARSQGDTPYFWNGKLIHPYSESFGQYCGINLLGDVEFYCVGETHDVAN